MRSRLSMLIATMVLVGSAAAAGPDAAATGDPGSEQSSQAAVWTMRRLHGFGIPIVPLNSYLAQGVGIAGAGSMSCDDLVRELRFLLLQFGARASDLNIDERGCRDEFTLVDATFSVLVPADKAGENAAATFSAASWTVVELATGNGRAPEALVRSQFPSIDQDRLFVRSLRTCSYFRYVTKTLLPLFSVRDVKLIPNAICDKTGIGLRAEVLVPVQPLADAR